MTDAPSFGRRLAEIVFAFSKLGLISFGGPVAHLGYLREEFVARRRWLDEAAYADLVALCQFLPGPASSQVVFALGMKRAGLAGALAASACFLAPSAAAMIAFAYGVKAAGDLRGAGWLHGLKLAAVAVVAQAVWGMGKALCPDRARLTIALAAAAALLAAPGALAQVAAIAAGALLGWLLYRRSVEVPAAEPAPVRGHVPAALALALCAALLAALPALARATHLRWLAEADAFYRAGALVFGGGHVVLPLLRAELVPRGWISDDRFLAGYGAAQAVPGPLFSFSAFLGATMGGWPRGLLALFSIFLPAWLLIGGALPFWHSLRSRRWAQAALRGANAAVVGVLLAALWSPVIVEGVKGPRDVALALAAFGLLVAWRAPAWIVVLLAAAAGPLALR